jgi:hypothetical protein
MRLRGRSWLTRCSTQDDHPYLHATVSYSRLGARVLHLLSRINSTPQTDLPYAEIESLDKEIMQWYDSSPEEVKVRDWTIEKRMASTPSYNLQRLQIWTYLRFNQVRQPHKRTSPPRDPPRHLVRTRR